MIKNHGSKSTNLTILGIICFVAVITIVIIFVIHSLRGEIKTNKLAQEDGEYISLTCKANGFDYPFTYYDYSLNKDTNITVIFENNRLKSIALLQNLYYDNAEKIKDSYNLNYSGISLSISDMGLKIGDLAEHFSQRSDKMVMSLYVPRKKMSEKTKRYFLIDYIDTETDSIDKYKEIYEKLGFGCSLSDNNDNNERKINENDE